MISHLRLNPSVLPANRKPSTVPEGRNHSLLASITLTITRVTAGVTLRNVQSTIFSCLSQGLSAAACASLLTTRVPQCSKSRSSTAHFLHRSRSGQPPVSFETCPPTANLNSIPSGLSLQRFYSVPSGTNRAPEPLPPGCTTRRPVRPPPRCTPSVDWLIGGPNKPRNTFFQAKRRFFDRAVNLT